MFTFTIGQMLDIQLDSIDSYSDISSHLPATEEFDHLGTGLKFVQERVTLKPLAIPSSHVVYLYGKRFRVQKARIEPLLTGIQMQLCVKYV